MRELERMKAVKKRTNIASIHPFHSFTNSLIKVVRAEGLEPPCLAAPDPKSGMSTNSTTPADATISNQIDWVLILDCKGTFFFEHKKRVLIFSNIFLI